MHSVTFDVRRESRADILSCIPKVIGGDDAEDSLLISRHSPEVGVNERLMVVLFIVFVVVAIQKVSIYSGFITMVGLLTAWEHMPI